MRTMWNRLRFVLLILVVILIVLLPAGAEDGQREILELRTESVKQYLLPSGAMRAVAYPEPVHFRNEENQWEDIDLNWKDSGDSSLERHYGRVFASRSILDAQTLQPGLGVRVNSMGVERVNPHDYDFAAPKNRFAALTSKSGRTVLNLSPDKFLAFWPVLNASNHSHKDNEASFWLADNISVDQLVLSSGIKEDIILSDANVPSYLEYRLLAVGLLPRVEDNAIVLYDTDGNAQMVMPQPYMSDSGGSESTDVQFELTQLASNQYSLKIVWDKRWLSESGRQFPVVVDPTTTVLKRTTGLTDTEICSSIFEQGQTHSEQPVISILHNWSGYSRRGLLQMDLSSAIPTNSKVLAATLYLHTESSSNGTVSQNTVQLWTAPESWDYSATWVDRSKLNGTAWTTAGAYNASCTYLGAAQVTTAGSTISYSLPIGTSGAGAVIPGWVANPVNNKGFLLKLESETGTIEKHFHSADGNASLAPALEITYELVPVIDPTSLKSDADLNGDAMKRQLSYSVYFPFTRNGFSIRDYPSGADCAVEIGGLASGKNPAVSPVSSTAVRTVTLDQNTLTPNCNEVPTIKVTPRVNGVVAGQPVSAAFPPFSTALNTQFTAESGIHYITAHTTVNSACTVHLRYWKRGAGSFDNPAAPELTAGALVGQQVDFSLQDLEAATEYEYAEYFSWPSGVQTAPYPVQTCMTKKLTDVTYTYSTNNLSSTSNSMTVSWGTNQNVDSILRVSDHPDMTGSVDFVDSARVTNHTVTATGLAPGTTYYFVLASNQAETTSTTVGNVQTLPCLTGVETSFSVVPLRNGPYGSISVNTANGNAIIAQTDLVLPGRTSLTVARAFNSQRTENVGLGPGWSFAYDSYLRFDPFGTAVLVDPDGSEHTFPKNGEAFVSAKGQYADLTATGTGYEVLYKDGGKRIYSLVGDRYWLTETRDRLNRSVLVRRDSNGRIAALRRDYSGADEIIFSYLSAGLLNVTTKPFSNDSTDPQKTYQVSYTISGRDLKVSYPFDTSDSTVSANPLTCEYYFGAGTWFVKDPKGNDTRLFLDNRGRLINVGTNYSYYSDESQPQLFTFSKLLSEINILYLTTPDRTTVQDPQGYLTTLEHYADGTLRKVTQANAGWTEYVRDANYNVTTLKQTMKDASNIVTTAYAYDTKGNLTLETRDVGGKNVQTKAVYEPRFNQITAMMDGEQMAADVTTATVSFNYDHTLSPSDGAAVGLLKQVRPKYVAGSSKNANYEIDLEYQNTYYDLQYKTIRNTNSARLSNFGAVKFEYVYDENGLLSKVFNLDSTQQRRLVSLYKRNLLGQLLYQVDGNGLVKRFEYDGYGRLLRSTRPMMPDSNLLTELRNELGAGFTPVSLPAPSQDYTYEGSVTYDENGNITEEKDAMDKSTIRQYDELGRLIAVTPPGLSTTYYGFDAASNLAWQRYKVNGVSSPTRYTYNEMGQVTHISDPSLVTNYQDIYGYDLAGRQTSVKEGCADENNWGRMTKYTYDNLSQVSAQEFFLDGNTTAVKTISRTYDRNGNMTRSDTPVFQSVQDGSRLITDYTFDDAGRVTAMAVSCASNPLYGYTSSFDYGCGQLLRETMKGQVTDYVYDDALRLKSLSASGQTYVFTYYPGGQRKTLAYGSLITATYGYDQAYRLTDLNYSWSVPNQSKLHYAYSHDPDGRLTKAIEDGVTDAGLMRLRDEKGTPITNAPPTNVLPRVSPRTSSSAYDDAGRLTGYFLPADGYAIENWGSFVYDDIGNRTSGHTTIGTGEEASDLSYSYVYQLDNKLVSETTSFLSGGHPPTTNDYTYDRMGQQISDGTDSYAYSEMGNMISGAHTLYYYDGDGVIRRKKSSAPNADDYYYYGATGLYGVDHDGSYRSFARLGGQLLGSSDGFFILQDGRGDVVALVSKGVDGVPTGQIVGAYTYDTYGQARSIDEIDDIVSPFRFAGGLFDGSTGKYVFGARTYDPGQGRWMSKDVYKGNAGDPLSLNSYAYCCNDPVNFVDPSGFNPIRNAWVASSRALWQLAIRAYLEPKGFDVAAALMRNCLQDNPSALHFGQGDSITQKILQSSEWNSEVDKQLAAAKANGLESFTVTGSMAFRTGDLFMALHNVDYTMSGKLEGGVWTITTTMSDTFDFTEWNAQSNAFWANSANNLALADQSYGIIVPYGVTVQFSQTAQPQ